MPAQLAPVWLKMSRNSELHTFSSSAVVMMTPEVMLVVKFITAPPGVREACSVLPLELIAQ